MIAADAFFRACADPTRPRILGLLRDGGLCVGVAAQRAAAAAAVPVMEWLVPREQPA